MDLGSMRQFLRTTMEVEAEDWPDELIDAGLKEGYERIIAREQRWPFYEGRWTFNTSSATQGYFLPDAASDLREVTAVRLNGARIQFVDEDSADRRWAGKTGSAVAWSRWGDYLNLWPTPADGGLSIEVRGYRQPQPFESISGWEPDMPVQFHGLLIDWALGSEYQRQDDVEMMTSYRNKFEEQLTSLRKAAMASPTPGPIVMGGDGLLSRR